jgi:hypothetical protein
MGGYGSGRESRGHKSTVEAAKVISLRASSFKRANALRPGLEFTIPLQDDYGTHKLNFKTQEGSFLLWFEGHQQARVKHETQSKPFGGFVAWWICPRCNRRTNRIFPIGGWRCGKCARLCYASQLMDRKERLLHKVRTINRELGVKDWDNHFASPLFKPKGMHQTTWQRKLAEHRAAFDAWNNLSLGGMLAFINRVEARWGKTKA